MASRTLSVKITGDAASLRAALGQSEAHLSGFSAKADAIGSKLQSAGKKLSLAVTLPTLALARSAFLELQESEKMSAITTAHIKSTGGAANVTAKHVDKMSSSLMNLSGVDDELIHAGANMLLTFKRVRNETGAGNKIFDRATKAALDLSFQFGSTDSAAKQLGKALSDPLKGMGALKKAGVDFTDQQKFMIAALMASGDVLGAQKIILSEVESQVGDTASAYGKTLGGQVGRAKEAFKNAAADILSTLAPALESLSGIIRKVADFLKNMPGWAKAGFAALATGAAVLGPLLWVVGGIAKHLATIKSLGGAAKAVQVAGGNSTVAGAGGAAVGAARGGAAKAIPFIGAAVIGGMATLEAMGALDKWTSSVNVTMKELATQQVPTLSQKFQGLADHANSVRGYLGMTREALLRTGSSEIQANVEGVKQKMKVLADEVGNVAKKSPEMARKMVESAAAAGFPISQLTILNDRLGKYKFKLNELPALKKTTIVLEATGAFGAIARMKTALGGLNQAANFKIPGHAAGGPASGMTWVGERGPELVSLPSGSFVHNSIASRAMATRGGSPNVNVYVRVDPITGQAMIEKIQERENVTGPSRIGGG